MSEILNDQFHLDFFYRYYKGDMYRPNSITYIPRQMELLGYKIYTAGYVEKAHQHFLNSVIEYRVDHLYSDMRESLAGIQRLIQHQLWMDSVFSERL